MSTMKQIAAVIIAGVLIGMLIPLPGQAQTPLSLTVEKSF